MTISPSLETLVKKDCGSFSAILVEQSNTREEDFLQKNIQVREKIYILNVTLINQICSKHS